MNIPRLVAALAFATAFSAVVSAQQQPTGYHSVACFKVNPGKELEHRKWWDEEGRKVMQATVDSGQVVAYYRLRSVMPSGSSAACDVVTVTVYPAFPPEPPSRQEFEALMKKAGLTSTAQDFMARRDAARTAVSTELFQTQVAQGSIAKGNYLVVNYMKTTHVSDWLNMEKTIWQPLAEAMIKDGIQNAWMINLLILPAGDDSPYQGVSVDAYPTLEAAVKGQSLDPHFDERFKKAHPGVDEDSTLDKAMKTRTQSITHLYRVEDVITSGKS